MKPGNKLERRCWELHPKLPALTIKQFEWARKIFGQTAYFNVRKGMITGKYRCTECGHEWDAQGNTEVTCPHCGAILKVEKCKKKIFQKRGYYVIVSEIEEWVVFRYFWFDHICNATCRIWCNTDEVMQLWYDAAGNEVTIARNKVMYPSCCYNIFSTYSPMSIKRPDKYQGYYGNWDIRDIDYKDVYTEEMPRRFSYVDWSPYKADKIDTVYIMRHFLRSPMVETLMKLRQNDLLSHMIRRDCFNPKNVYRDAYVNGARLAIKHKYFDGDKSYITWLDLIKNLVDLGKDWHNPTLVLPDNLEEKHAEYSRAVLRQEAEKRSKADLERHMKLEAQYEEGRKQFFDFNITEGDIHIEVLKGVADFFVEGGEMKHCVYTNGYYNLTTHPYSLILSARQGNWNNPKKFLETIEVSLKDFTIIQSRGHCNTDSDFHKQIVELMKAHMDEIKELCKRKSKEQTKPLTDAA